jgi:hypothetical protein
MHFVFKKNPLCSDTLTHWNLEMCSHNFLILTSFTINSFGSVFTQFSVLISFKVNIILEVCLHNFQF